MKLSEDFVYLMVTPTIVKQCGFVCGQMGERDVKIYCNEVSGTIEKQYRIHPLTDNVGYVLPTNLSEANEEFDNETMSNDEQLQAVWLVDMDSLPRY
jgi:hypothetical protein